MCSNAHYSLLIGDMWRHQYPLEIHESSLHQTSFQLWVRTCSCRYNLRRRHTVLWSSRRRWKCWSSWMHWCVVVPTWPPSWPDIVEFTFPDQIKWRRSFNFSFSNIYITSDPLHSPLSFPPPFFLAPLLYLSCALCAPILSSSCNVQPDSEKFR